MVPAEGRLLFEIMLDDPASRLQPDFFKSRRQDLAVWPDATDDDVDMRIALATSTGLVMKHKRGLMIFGPEVP